MPRTNKRKIRTKRVPKKRTRTRRRTTKRTGTRTKRMKGGSSEGPIPPGSEIPLEYFEDSGRLERGDSGVLDETNSPLVRTTPHRIFSDYEGKEREIKLDAEHSHMQLTYEIKNIAQEVTKLKDIMKELKEENELIKRELNI